MEDETLHYRRAADLRTNMDDTEFGGGDVLGLRTVEWVLPRSAESRTTVCQTLGFGILRAAGVVSRGLVFPCNHRAQLL